MRRNWLLIGLLAALLGGLSSCAQQTEYEKLVAQELATGDRYDSLFFGLYLGMRMDSFYNRCWELNKDSILRQGPMNQSVLFELPEEFGSPASMFFYPTPFEGNMYEMPVRFSYRSWSPWNKEFHSDKLLPLVQGYLQERYPGEFYETKDKDGQRVLYQIKGNRRILLGLDTDQYVKAVFTDLTQEQAYLNQRKQAAQ